MHVSIEQNLTGTSWDLEP